VISLQVLPNTSDIRSFEHSILQGPCLVNKVSCGNLCLIFYCCLQTNLLIITTYSVLLNISAKGAFLLIANKEGVSTSLSNGIATSGHEEDLQ